MKKLVICIAYLSLTACMGMPAPSPTSTDTKSEVPISLHKFYDRPNLVTFCYDRHMIFVKNSNACARAYAHSCLVAMPYNWAPDREIFAICNSFSPRI